MDTPTPPSPAHPLLSVSAFLHHHLHRFGSHFSHRLDGAKQFLGNALLSHFPRPRRHRHHSSFASLSSHHQHHRPNHAFDLALTPNFVANTLSGTSVYTVSNSNNEFVLVSDPNSLKSLGLLCFRHEDADALLAQVQLRQPVLGRGARVVPITLDQVYMLKVEGIAFRFLPDPAQIRNALELKTPEQRTGFDGVPVFQSDLLVVKKKNRRYCPIYFQKEDIEKELKKVSSRSGTSQHIMVGNLEDVLKKMETNEKNSGWEDIIFIPPGKSYSQRINEAAVA
ncbi:hypothetical protein Scep_001618 [Stephania cephalantha]|uniref:Protein TIC 22, chloroplastic n=1 Tax=Stephania cephalantha TaxID=152367 RepID=A0AAP0L9R4_9MAGN